MDSSLITSHDGLLKYKGEYVITSPLFPATRISSNLKDTNTQSNKLPGVNGILTNARQILN